MTRWSVIGLLLLLWSGCAAGNDGEMQRPQGIAPDEGVSGDGDGDGSDVGTGAGGTAGTGGDGDGDASKPTGDGDASGDGDATKGDGDAGDGDAGDGDAGDGDAGDGDAGDGDAGDGDAGDGDAGDGDAGDGDAGDGDAGDGDAGGGDVPDPEPPVDPPPPTHEEFCMGGGPVVTVPDTVPQGQVCTPQLGRRLFNHALCTCEDTRFAGYMVTRSFSGAAASPLVAAGAPVGINDQLVSGSYVDVGGTLRVIGTTAFAGFLQVGGDLELQQDLVLPGYLEVARDAWLAEDAVMTAATIGRDLYTQPGKWLPPPWVVVGGSWQQGTFGFDDPCPCEDDQILDIASIVADGLAQNDNAVIPLDPASLTGHVGYRRIELPCGRFYLDEISGIGDITLVVNGRTALYVGGDVSTIGRFDVEIGPDGELDLFIDGDLDQIGYGTFGDPSRPSRVRVYVSGSGDITFLGYQPVGANIYAPRARMVSAGYVDMEGSLFLRELDAGAYIDIAYDRDIVDVDECEPPEDPPGEDPPPECSDKCDGLCGQRTCDESTGECAGCTTDADCCAPLVCYPDGRCGPLLD